jgi:excisionase family DNA binding protein
MCDRARELFVMSEGEEKLQKLLFSPEEAALMLSVSRTVVYNLLRQRKLKGILVGGRRKVSMKAIHRFIDEQEMEREDG